MKKLIAAACAATALVAGPAMAHLAVGTAAPTFSAPGYQGGKALTFDMKAALKKGPVVLYFFPAAHTSGCNAEAHLFADAMDQFKAQGATVIGVTSGNIDQLAAFSAETEHCSGKFPVASDPNAAIAKTYESELVMRPGWSSRDSYVIAPDGKILFVYSDLNPTQHVALTLDAVKKWRAEHPK